MSTPLRADVDPSRYAISPSDAEKYQYLRGGQKRWLLVVQYVAFLAVVISFAGFTLSSYLTFVFSIPLVIFAVEQTLAPVSLDPASPRQPGLAPVHRRELDPRVSTRR